jgi:hypothetical protein
MLLVLGIDQRLHTAAKTLETLVASTARRDDWKSMTGDEETETERTKERGNERERRPRREIKIPSINWGCSVLGENSKEGEEG